MALTSAPNVKVSWYLSDHSEPGHACTLVGAPARRAVLARRVYTCQNSDCTAGGIYGYSS